MNLVGIRWAARLTLVCAVAASVSANILHAEPNPISQAIAAWPPLALLLTIELVSRVPVHRRSLAGMRIAATTIISGIAAWVSYWHMVGVAAKYGETDASPYLLPISVDGLIIVASICLVELARKPESRPEAADLSGYLAKSTGGLITEQEPLNGGTPPNSRVASLSHEDQQTPNRQSVLVDRPTKQAADDLKQKAIQWVKDYQGPRTLTGPMVGAEFGRGRSWGQEILRKAETL